MNLASEQRDVRSCVNGSVHLASYQRNVRRCVDGGVHIVSEQRDVHRCADTLVADSGMCVVVWMLVCTFLANSGCGWACAFC